MRVHAFICTRSKNLNNTTNKLVKYLKDANVLVSLIVNSSSIFTGYQRAYDQAKPDPNDIIILCHDDLEILNTKESFIEILLKSLTKDPMAGFVGVAGTSYLSEDAIWWNQNAWKEGYHSGYVLHGNDVCEAQPTFYGPYKEVVALDGLFLAATARTIEKVGLSKPDYLEGDWDFYDILYTTSAKRKGLVNKTIPLIILHNSLGELVGRDSWTKNREAYIKNNRLPLTCNP